MSSLKGGLRNPAGFLKGQARFPLLLTIFLLAGLALSQTEGLPPLLTWTSQSTEASWDGSVFSSSNTLTASNVPAGTINVIVSGCPADWICLADPAAIEHNGADASYPVNLMIIAPQNASGTLIVTASDSMEANSNEWSVAIIPVEVPPEQPPPPPPPSYDFKDISACGELTTNTKLVQDIRADKLHERWGACIVLMPGLPQKMILDCQGHSIVGAGTGIGIFYADNEDNGWEIRNCKIEKFDYGLHTESDRLVVRNVQVSNCNVAWQMGGASPIAAIDSSFTNSDTGIIFYYTLPVVFTNVKVTGISGYPFVFQGIAGDEISENKVANLTASGFAFSVGSGGIEIRDSSFAGIEFADGNIDSNKVRLIGTILRREGGNGAEGEDEQGENEDNDGQGGGNGNK